MSKSSPSSSSSSSSSSGRSSRSVFSAPRTSRGWAKLRKLQDNPFVQLALFVGFVLATVAVMTAGFDVRGAELEAEQVGKPALREVKASRDFVYVEKDTEATERRRERVARSVPPVYDWHEGRGEQIRDQVREAFEAMRSQIAAQLRQEAALEGPSPEPTQPAPTPSQKLSDTELIEAHDPDRVVRLARELRAEHFEQAFPAPISDQNFERFARQGFSPRLESALTTLVHEVMSELIVPSSRIIEEERERGIYLRRIRDEKTLIEYHVIDLRGRLVGREAVPGMLRERVTQRDALESPQLRATLVNVADALIHPNTLYNEAHTLQKREAARQAVSDVVVRQEFRKGQLIVDKDQLITQRHVHVYERMLEEDGLVSATQIIAGLILFTLLLLVTLLLFGRHNIDGFELKPKDVAFVAISMLLFLLLARLGKAMSYALADELTSIPAEAWLFTIPVAGAGMLVRLVLESEHTIIFALIYALLVGLIMDELLFYTTFTLLGCLVGAHFMRQVKHRLALMWSGLVVGLINVTALLGYLLLQGELLQADSLIKLLMGFGGGIASGFFVSAILPVFEAGFSYTTDIKLLELANLNHPLLRKLILHSPGSYHHSMMVGSLCESAAEEIGCNSLLARVGAYYHDVGKAKNPGYFAENQKYGENPHDKLKPNMSALIIKAHVKDGVEMARQERLPKEIIAFIEQHHGTSLISYFYHKAKQMEDPDIPEVNEKDYRYPGPKPQSRETAICLLADGIEAASRAMPNKSPARLKGLVQTMINRAFTDGQLDECDLTLKDLNAIAQAFIRILTGIYHHRPEYPDAKKSKSKKTEESRPGKARSPGRAEERSVNPKKTTPEADEGASGDERADEPGADPGVDKDPEADEATPPEERDDEDRGADEGDGEEPPDARDDDPDVSAEGRASLPRLGSS